MTVEDFCALHAIDLADIDRIEELARDAVSAVVSQRAIESVYDTDDAITIIVYPAINHGVAAQLITMLCRSPEYDALRERTGRRVFVRVGR